MTAGGRTRQSIEEKLAVGVMMGNEGRRERNRRLISQMMVGREEEVGERRPEGEGEDRRRTALIGGSKK